MERSLHGALRHGAALRGDDPRLRLGPVVENLLAGPMLRHQPLRRDLRRPPPLLPLHLHQQSLPNEPQIHRRRHSPKNHHALRPSNLDQFHQNRNPRLDDHNFLIIYPTKHLSHGNSTLNCDVRRILRQLNDSGGGFTVYNLVHALAFPLRVSRREAPDNGAVSGDGGVDCVV